LTIKFADNGGISGCIPVKYRINNGAVISECAVSSGVVNNYTFNTKLNFSSYGTYQLEAWTDVPADIYKTNDTLKMIIAINPLIAAFPYNQDFDIGNGTGFWHAEGYKSSWELGTPASLKIKKAASGTRAWKTSLRGQYNENELSYLYSPCFDISSLSNPYFAFNIAMDIEQCGQTSCDKFWVEYSADGKTWNKLGTYGQGVNWYNRKSENVWDSANYTSWHTAGINLPTGIHQLQLRFVLFSDASVTREGVAIDDIQIFDKQVNTSANVEWNIYPNPVNNFAELISNHQQGKIVSLALFNTEGQLIMQQKFTATGFLDNTFIDLSRFAKGIYALKVDDGTTVKVFKLMKQ
jgi:hypothetical protein